MLRILEKTLFFVGSWTTKRSSKNIRTYFSGMQVQGTSLGTRIGDVAALLFVATAIYADVGVSLLIGRHSIW